MRFDRVARPIYDRFARIAGQGNQADPGRDPISRSTTLTDARRAGRLLRDRRRVGATRRICARHLARGERPDRLLEFSGRHLSDLRHERRRQWPDPGDEQRSANPLCRGRIATIAGTPGNDLLTGSVGDDLIVARDGNDDIRGREGADLICGGPG